MLNGLNKVEKKPVTTGIVKRTQTYRALSPVYIDRLGSFEIEWFCKERTDPIGPHEEFVESNRWRDIAGDRYAMSFTKKEINMLEAYLWDKYQWGVRQSRKDVLMRSCTEQVLCLNKYGEFSTVDVSKELRYVDLSLQKDYSLPFKVIGYGRAI